MVTPGILLAPGQTQLRLSSKDSEMLDEVVLTALGIKRSEKALSYNVQEIKSESLNTVRRQLCRVTQR